VKPSVLLIECHHDPEEEKDKLQAYIDWLAPFFKITHVYVAALTSTEVKEDGVVVTGSRWQIATDPVPDVITKLFLETGKPLLGVCWGHQTLAHAWGGQVIRKNLFIEKTETIRVERSEVFLDGMGLYFSAHESHYEHVVPDANLKKHFEILAYSSSCKVEVIRHKERLLWGVQFHPERSGSSGRQLAANFANIVVNAAG
jgi:GMP synthase-like glutamine amidotransferase